MCGAMSPMKPMPPATATTAPTVTACSTNSEIRSPRTGTPSEWAVSSPALIASSQPWIRDFELSPTSVVRDMFERAMSFAEYVSFYQLQRSEGLVLRYLSDAYRAIRQTVPAEARSDELVDIIEWLGELVRQVDSSLVDEWSALIDPAAHLPEDDVAVVPPAPPSILTNRRAFTVLVRNELFRRVQLAALQDDDALVALDPDVGWPEVLDRYFDEHDEILTGGPARSRQARVPGRHLRLPRRRPGVAAVAGDRRRGRPGRSARASRSARPRPGTLPGRGRVRGGPTRAAVERLDRPRAP